MKSMPTIPKVRKLETVVSPPASDYIYHFSEQEKNALALLLQHKTGESFKEHTIYDFLEFAGKEGKNAFEAVSAIAEKLSARNNKLGFMLMRNLPVDALEGMTKQSCLSELQLICISHFFGVPFNYANRRSGTLIDNIMPNRNDAKLQLGTNSVDLFWHTEDAHLSCSSDYIALFCLRGDPAAHTIVSCIHEDELDPQILLEMAKPHFIISPDGSFVNSKTAHPQAILDVTGSTPRLRFDPLFTKCTNGAAEAIMEEIINHLNNNAVSIELKSGDILIIDNRRCVHARTSFKPRYNDNDRWVQRLLFFEDDIEHYAIDPQYPYLIKAQ